LFPTVIVWLICLCVKKNEAVSTTPTASLLSAVYKKRMISAGGPAALGINKPAESDSFEDFLPS